MCDDFCCALAEAGIERAEQRQLYLGVIVMTAMSMTVMAVAKAMVVIIEIAVVPAMALAITAMIVPVVTGVAMPPGTVIVVETPAVGQAVVPFVQASQELRKGVAVVKRINAEEIEYSLAAMGLELKSHLSLLRLTQMLPFAGVGPPALPALGLAR